MSSPSSNGGGGGDDGDLDFANEPLPPNSLAPPPREKPFDPEPGREKTRAVLAGSLVVVASALAFLAYWFLAEGWIDKDGVQSLSPYFASLATLAGTAIGFYFGGGGSKPR